MIDRILQIIKEREKSARAFAARVGFNYTTLNGYIVGARKAIDVTLLTKIISAYEDISAEWLLTGKGEMLKSEYAIIENVVREEPAIYGSSWKDKYIAEIEENKKLNRTIVELTNELRKFEKKTAARGSGASVAPTGTGGA
jgi:Helix-turn-helix.